MKRVGLFLAINNALAQVADGFRAYIFEERETLNLKTTGHPMKKIMFLSFLALIFTLLSAQASSAATVTTAGDGNWNSTTNNAPWPGGVVPAATDDVIILPTHDVTVTANATINSITLGSNNTATTRILTVNSGVTLTVTAGITMQNDDNTNMSATITGAGTITCASFTVGGTTTNLSGDATTTLTSTISTLSISGNLTIDGEHDAGDENNALFLLGAGIVNVGGTVTLTSEDDGTAGSGDATLSLDTGAETGTLNLTGATPFSIGGTGTETTDFNGTGATVIYAGAAQTVLATTYTNLTISGSATKTLAAATTVENNLTIDSGVTLDVAAITLTIATGTIIIDGTLDFSASGGSATSTGASVLTMNSTGLIRTADDSGLGPVANASLIGTWTTTTIDTNGTVEYNRNATSGQVVTDRNYNNLTITGSTQTKTWTIAATRTVNGNVTINSSAPLTMSGAQIVNVKGNWSNSGTFTAGTGTINFNGAVNQSIGGSSSTTFNNLTITNTGATDNNLVSLGINTSVGAALTISDGILNQGATFNLTVTGATTINSGGTLNILNGQTGNFTGGAVTVNSGGGWEVFGGTGGDPVVITLTSTVTNTGLIHFDSTVIGCGTDDIQIRSSVGGTQRTWSGAGSFVMQDVNVQDQNKSGTAITANSSTNNGNNTNWTFTVTCNVVTEVTLASFAALGNDRQGVYLQWQTGYEVRNLGFNIYREVKGKRTKLNATLIAGSALMVGSKIRLTAGLSYGWLDTTANGADFAQYFLEDVDLGGQTTLHGPISPTSTSKLPAQADALLLSKLNSNSATVKQQFITPLIKSSNSFGKSIVKAAGSIQTQWDVAGQPGAKLSVRSDGWYRVTQPELVAAGFNVSSNPNFLQLYVDGVQQPIKVNGGTSGHLEAGDSLEFYAKAIDTPSTNLRAYYLINGNAQGQRINTVAGSGIASTAQNFSATIERKERSTYFAALRNGDADNWFGAIITSDAVTQTLAVEHLDASSATGAALEVALQGVTADTSHSVKVKLNGIQVGTISFNGQAHQVSSLAISNSALIEGNNTVSFEAEGGDLDINLLDYVRLTYSHTFAADNNRLLYTAAGQELVTISGFNSSAIRVVDITDSANPKEISGTTNGSGNNFSVTVAAQDAGQRVLYAFADSAVSQAAEVRANQPSSWNRATQVADLVIITPRNFIASFDALKTLRRSQGYTVVVADVEDLYDEFSYGARTPQAIKDFLVRARSVWKRAPKFVLLGGDASSDPKNYLGLGDNDHVPTKLIDTALMVAASDDWLVDFNDDGLPEMAIGRMPARTANESATMVRKTVEYAQLARPEGALLVTDTNDEFNFEATSNEVKALIPNSIVVREVMRSAMDDQTAHAQILGHLQRGPKIVNYLGHGSFGLWRGNLLTSADGASLSNGPEYSFVIGMTCLNGQVQDPFGDGLAEALMKVEQGGAIAVWASSALTEPDGQALMNKELFRHLFPAFKSSAPGLTLGEAVMKAKAASSDIDVKRSWILLGDPTIKLR